MFKLPPHQINAKSPLEDYGIDSILTINITNQLEKTFGTLSKTLLFEYQTIHELAAYFIEVHTEKVEKLIRYFAQQRPAKIHRKPPGNKSGNKSGS
ncbi:MAG: acyl carrier protein [Bacteroidales bacterium]|nr:acyl carrier protein [Bacteroidales bacterium]